MSNAVTPRETSPLLGAGSVQRSPEVVEAPEQDGSVFGPWIKPLVYGGMDGIVSVFVGVIVAVLTDKPSLTLVLSLTLAKLFAGAFSMGAGELVSSKAEVDYAKGERAREAWECNNFKEGEVDEMVELYVSRGYKEETARRIVTLLAKDDALFVNIMMVEELEIPPEQEEQNPYKNALVNFAAFFVFGSLPVLPFVVFQIGLAVTNCANCTWTNTMIPFYISIGLTSAGVVGLGVLKAYVTGLRVWVSVSQAAVGALLSVGAGGGIGYGIYAATNASV